MGIFVRMGFSDMMTDVTTLIRVTEQQLIEVGMKANVPTDNVIYLMLYKENCAVLDT